MKFNYELKIGDKSFYIEEEASSMVEFFKKVAPYQALEIESAGRAGVFLSHRVTKGGDEYFALIQPAEDLEFHFGVVKEGGGRMFPGKYIKEEKRTDKRWAKVQYGSGAQAGEEQEETAQATPASLNGQQSQPIQPKTEQEERLTVQIRELMDAAGISNVGQEKQKILKSLGLKVGLLLKELSYHQKLDLYQLLFEEAKALSNKRPAAV